MITVLCGHRGTGKTSLLKRISKYFPASQTFDLDAEIEKGEEKSVSQIFKTLGENYFRKLELKYFSKLAQTKNICFIAVGGGFPIDSLDSKIKVWWIRRDSDSAGRVFLNRPALDLAATPLNDYLKVFTQRERNFLARADYIYTVPPGITDPNILERQMLRFNIEPRGYYTLTNAAQSLNFESTTYELRTDLLTQSDFEKYLTTHPYHKFILSYRGKNFDQSGFLSFVARFPNCAIDWALEQGAPPDGLSDREFVLSFHGEVSDKNISLLNSYQQRTHLKFSPFCADFVELKKALQWQSESSANRSLLPRSENGRWAWVRLLLRKQKINFWRNGLGSAIDQPTLYEWLSQTEGTNFAAVLGAPVDQSWSPIFHQKFFASRQMNFYRIQIEKSEWSNAMDLLSNLGLKAAAVTSPLKQVAADFVSSADPINTLVHSKKWHGLNTDVEGPMAWPLWARRKNIALWGGEGTAVVKNNFAKNQMVHFSSRTGKPKDGTRNAFQPEVLVWGAPRHPETKWPPEHWPLKLIIDLNYSESSMGKELALLRKIEYISGAEFFKAQGHAQQQIWSQYL